MKKINIPKITLFSLLYWLLFLIPIVLVENFAIYSTLIILSCLAYIPYRIFLNQQENPEIYKDQETGVVVKKEIKPTITAFLIFLGVLMITNSVFVPQIKSIVTSIQYTSIKNTSEKVVDLKSLDIYIDEDNQKAYSFYKIDGTNGKTFMDVEHLISEDNSEIKERYGEFHLINDYEIAFATHKNQLYTEALFKVILNNKTYLIKSYLPQENALSLLTKAGFKEALNIKFKDGTVKDIYINKNSKEIALSDDNVVITSKYAETPYNKEDYFSYRYDIFNNYVKDKTMIQNNINVSLLNTYSGISDDIKRVTFYLETSEDSKYIYTEIVEIIFAEVSYVFRTGIIDVTNIESINRAE